MTLRKNNVKQKEYNITEENEIFNLKINVSYSIFTMYTHTHIFTFTFTYTCDQSPSPGLTQASHSLPNPV